MHGTEALSPLQEIPVTHSSHSLDVQSAQPKVTSCLTRGTKILGTEAAMKQETDTAGNSKLIMILYLK